MALENVFGGKELVLDASVMKGQNSPNNFLILGLVGRKIEKLRKGKSSTTAIWYICYQHNIAEHKRRTLLTLS